MDAKEEAEAQHAVGLVNTLMVTSLMATLQAKGVLTQADRFGVMDLAMTGAETATGMEPEVAMRVRRILELIAVEMGAGPKAET